jgi:hypothetical protein
MHILLTMFYIILVFSWGDGSCREIVRIGKNETTKSWKARSLSIDWRYIFNEHVCFVHLHMF